VLNVLQGNRRARRLYERCGFLDEHTCMTKDLRR
jgi:RimJ/RimL family protein N-acetyltransferase